ncbi:MAG: hypothetical protein PVI91_18030, partial [Gammaproteobacteria bacterium]
PGRARGDASEKIARRGQCLHAVARAHGQHGVPSGSINRLFVRQHSLAAFFGAPGQPSIWLGNCS